MTLSRHHRRAPDLHVGSSSRSTPWYHFIGRRFSYQIDTYSQGRDGYKSSWIFPRGVKPWMLMSSIAFASGPNPFSWFILLPVTANIDMISISFTFRRDTAMPQAATAGIKQEIGAPVDDFQLT